MDGSAWGSAPRLPEWPEVLLPIPPGLTVPSPRPGALVQSSGDQILHKALELGRGLRGDPGAKAEASIWVMSGLKGS